MVHDTAIITIAD